MDALQATQGLVFGPRTIWESNHQPSDWKMTALPDEVKPPTIVLFIFKKKKKYIYIYKMYFKEDAQYQFHPIYVFMLQL